MPPNSVSRLHAEREAQFLTHMGTFIRGELEPIDAAVRSDVVMVLPGSSWLAGMHIGYDGVRRCITGLRRVLRAEDNQLSFIHGARHMIVRHDVVVQGRDNAVQMGLMVRVRYDMEDKVDALFVDPDDQDLFDHVANSLMSGCATA